MTTNYFKVLRKSLAVKILFSSFLSNLVVFGQPLQEMVANYYNKKNTSVVVSSSNRVINKDDIAAQHALQLPSFAEPTVKNTPTKVSTIYYASEQQGTVGKAFESEGENPYDNFFTVRIPENVIPDNYDAALIYELFGVSDASHTTKSINNHSSYGGKVVVQTNQWLSVKEDIVASQLKAGTNEIFFNRRVNENYQYSIRNIRIELKEKSTGVIRLNEKSLVNFNGTLYLVGTVASQYIKNVEVMGTLIEVNEGVFEHVLTNVSKDIREIKVSYVDKGSISHTISFPVSYQQDNVNYQFSGSILENSTKVYSINDFISASIVYNDLKVVFENQLLNEQGQLVIQGLKFKDVKTLNDDIENVTAGDYSAYRIMKRNVLDSVSMQLHIKYDPEQIPDGYTARDIKTFYFDKNQRSWKALPVDSLDYENKEIISTTYNNDTDYINGVIKVPDSPETGSFAPTMITDMKYADPASGVVSIPPPSPNSTGVATTSFPLKLPQGRNGMQPSLEINYNSEAGNGWMGIGWNLSTQAISINTKWGAPLFDQAKESELYSLNGADLVLKDGTYTNPHRKANIGRTKERIFYQRKEGGYQKIIRHGISTSTYWWEVVDKQGNTTFYGGVAAADPNYIIKDVNNNIAHWAIVKTIDPYGNYIEYTYSKSQSAIGTSTVMGEKFYPEKIRYTKHASLSSYYEIELRRNSYSVKPAGGNTTFNGRNDVTVSARNGYIQLIDQLLTEVHVSLIKDGSSDRIRSYRFDYQPTAFQKQQLIRISEFDTDSLLFYSNTLEYYTMNGPDIIDTVTPWAGSNDPISSPLPTLPGISANGSALGTSTAGGVSFGFRGGFGYGADVGKVNRTLGGSFNYSKNTQETSISFIDINGDGLPDKLVNNGQAVFYRPNTGQGFGSTFPLVNITELSKTKSRTVGGGVDASFGPMSIGKSWNKTKSETDHYFSDINGDGLVDIITGGIVKFNVISTIGRTFNNNVSLSENSIVPGSMSPDVIPFLKFDTMDELREQNPQFDHVKLWEAPYDGAINIQGTATLMTKNADTDNNTNEFKITIEKGLFSQLTGSATLLYAPTAVLSSNGSSLTHTLTHNVKKGDKIFFRIHNIETGYGGKLLWNPKITYTTITNFSGTNPNMTDENGKQFVNYDSKADFLLSNDEGVEIPYNDTSINIKFNLTPYAPLAFSDDIRFNIKLYKLNNAGEQELVTSWFRDYDHLTGSLSDLTAPYTLVSGVKYSLNIYTESSSNINWEAINWKPSFTGNNSGIHYLPVSHYNFDDNLNQSKNWIYGNTLPTPIINSAVPSDENQPMMVFTHDLLSQDFSSIMSSLPIGTVLQANWVIKQQNGSVARVLHKKNIYIIKISSGYVLSKTNNATNPTPISSDPTYTQFNLTKKQVKDIKTASATLFAAFYVSNNEINYNRNINLGIHSSQVSNYIFSAVLTKPFVSRRAGLLGNPYRGWSQFLYNGGLKFEHDNEGNITNNTPINFGTSPLDLSIFNVDAQKSEFDLNQNIPADNMVLKDAPVRYALYNQDNINSKYINGSIIGSNYGLNIDNSLTVTVGRFGEENLWNLYIDPNSLIQNQGSGVFRGIKQRSESKGSSISGGATYAGGTLSKATSRVLNEYIDLNGDRYPDLVSGGMIQYTNMLGSLSSTQFSNSFISKDESQDFIVGVTIPCQQATSDPSNNDNKGNKTNTNINSGINSSTGDSFNFNQWVDMNGDGLVDKVKIEGQNVTVSLNTGYGFTTEFNWYIGSKSYKSSSRSNLGIGLDLGANFGLSNSFAFGLGAAVSTANMETMLVDVNGDGLPDLVIKDDGVSTIYRYVLNRGDGFTGLPILFYRSLLEQDTSTSTNKFGAATFGIPIIVFGIPFKIVMTPSLGVNNTLSQKQITLQDINGDGLIDVIKKGSSTSNNSSIDAGLNRIGKTYLLKKVNTPLGGSWTIDYKREGNTYDMPQSKWVLDKIQTHDGFTADNAYKPDATLTTVLYGNPKHSRREREFLGYGSVSIQQKNPANSVVYRTVVKSYHNENYYLSGAEKGTALYDQSGQLLSEEKTLFNLLNPDAPIINIDANVENNFLQTSLVSTAKTVLDQWRLFVAVAKVSSISYENGQGLTSVKEFTNYDASGNIKTYIDRGEGIEDAYKTVIEYYPSLTGIANSLGFPKKVSVYKNNNNQLLRERSTTYNNLGKLEEIITKLNPTENNTVKFVYDDYGNLITVKELDNLKAGASTSYEKKIDYDPVVKTYPITFENSFGETSSTVYNYLFGMPVLTVDVNGQSMRTRIDNRGRVVEVTGPNEMATDSQSVPKWTIRTEYKDESALSGTLAIDNYMLPAKGNFTAAIPGAAQSVISQHFALTRHFDPEEHSPGVTTNQLLTVSIVDGLGQPIQVKKTLKSDVLRWQVSGFEEKDAFGRTIKSYLPTVQGSYPSNLSALPVASTNYFAVAASTLPAPVIMTYDAKDRMLSVKQPVQPGEPILPGQQEKSEITYGIEEGMFVQKVTNELSQKNYTYTDLRGRQRKTVQNEVITTKFEYNAINELIKVIDNNGFITGNIYDMAGRKTEMQHPDRGVVTFKYDKAGRMIEKSNSNLLLSGGLKIKYSYDFDRLIKIEYPQNTKNEVKYTYGLMSNTFDKNQNAVGRLLTQEDATGMQVFGYGLMGEVTENLRSVAVAGYQSYWFMTTWKYDSWNRVQEIVYPDQEKVLYDYNTGGTLHAIRSQITGISNVKPVVSSIAYNDYGERVNIVHGNGTKTSYAYDIRRRMDTLTHNFTNFKIIKNYGYDVLSNIKKITTVQPASSLPATGQIGGPVNHMYEYDTYNRLVHAWGNYTGPNDTIPYLRQDYDLLMEYNSDHTIKKKTQVHTQSLTTTYGGALTSQRPMYKNSYILDYSGYGTGAFVTGSSYGYQQPHAPRTISESASWVTNPIIDDPRIGKKNILYDANGNQTEIKEKVGNLETSLRKNLWDEENRLMAVDLKPDDTNNHPIAIYTYSGSDRIIRYNQDRVSVSSNAGKIGENAKDNIMIYPSGLLMGKVYHSLDKSIRVDRMTYTKHYYIGSERISAKTGTVADMGWYPTASVMSIMSGLSSTIRTSSKTSVTDAGIIASTIYNKFGQTNTALPPIDERTLTGYPHVSAKLDVYYFHPDHLGSSSYITNAAGTVSQHMEYLPFGETLVDEHTNSNNSPFKFNGKELDNETGNYYYGARYYDPKWSIFISVDPLAEENPDWTPYRYGFNNPVKYTDPTGMLESTDVTDNGDGTYKVVGGNLNDGDKGIYVVDKNGKRTGQKIGESLTMYSFYNADTWDADEGMKIGWVGSIDTNSHESGNLASNFMKKAEGIFIGSYMTKATDGKKYDFKRDGNPDNNDRDFHHRGSKWGVKNDGTQVYGTARDAGNFAAGYIAGVNNLSWGQARSGFDALELVKSGNLEGLQSTLSQRAGHNMGYPIGEKKAAQREYRRLTTYPYGPKY